MGKENKKKGKGVEFIKYETVKKFLEDNNVSLSSLGGEKEQSEYITKLSDALLEYRRAKSSKNVSIEEKAENISRSIGNVGAIIQEGNIPKNIADKLIKNFIPFQIPTKEESETIKKLQEQIKERNAIIEALKKENEELKRKQKEVSQDQSIDQEEQPKSAESEEKEITDVDYTIVDEPKITQESIDRYDGKIPDMIEIEGEKVGSRDETASEIFKDMLDKHKELRDQKKALKKSNPSIRTGKTIGKGVVDILSWSRDVLVCDIISGGVANLDHDIMLGGAFIALTGVAVTGYVAGRLTGKAIKGVANLGAKAIKGAVTLTGKAGKAIFKASKGTAQKCKKKADKIREEKRKNRIARTGDALKEADEATLQILDYSKRRLRVNEIWEEEYEDYDFSDDQLQYISDIRDDSKREETEDKIIQENEELLVEAKKMIRELSLIGITKDFQEKLGIKDPEEVKDFIDSIEIDENGDLVIGSDSGITIEDIESAGLYDKLKNVVELPGLNEISFEDIRNIVGYVESSYDLDEIVQNTGMDENIVKYIKVINENISESRANGEEISLDSLDIDLQTILNNNYILEEAYSRDLVDISKDLRKQVEAISIEFEGLRDGKQSKDDHRRETLRKIAEAKVKDLKNAGIIEVIQDGDRKQVNILGQAKDALSQDLAQDIEHTADIKRGKITYQQDNEEHDEK